MRRQNQFDRTDRDITNAVLSLMDRKPFEKITVQDILEEAMVNRSTFYQHFTDKYAVLERLQESIVSGVAERTARIRQLRDMDAVNEVLSSYLAERGDQLKKLLSVRSESLDMERHLREVLIRLIIAPNGSLSELEQEMFSGMLVRMFVFLLNRDAPLGELSSELTRAWLDMTLFFFRLDPASDAGDRIMRLLGSIYGEQNG